MLAVFKREFKSYFQNVIGWVFIAAMVFIASLYFRVYNLSGGYPDIRYIFMNLLMIIVFAIPVLAMRSFPEERKNKIDQLTLTSPVSIGKIVTGKYLAMVAVLGIATLIIGSFLFLIAGYTDVDWVLNGLVMLGFFLYGSAAIAVCVFISSFTESQVLAAIMGIICSFVIYMVAGIQYVFESSQNKGFMFVAKAMDVISFSSRFDTFLNGMFDIKAVIYFISVIAVFLFLTTQVIQKRRFTASVKNLSVQAFSVSMILIVIAVAVFGNLAIKSLPSKYTEFDTTAERLFTLTDATKKLVAEVNEPLHIYVYVDEGSKDETIDRVLNKYRELNKNITIEYKDPAKAPKLYEKYTEDIPTVNSLFMDYGSKTRYVNSNDMIANDYVYNEETQSYDTVSGYDIEGQITSGIYSLLYGTSVTIYNITGHDEAALEPGYLDALKKANCEVKDLTLLGNEIPEDCELILINAPIYDYSPDDVSKITAFFDRGGTAIITVEAIDSVTTDMPNYSDILGYFGVAFADGLVVDDVYYAQSPLFILPDVVDCSVTEGVYGMKNVWMPYCKVVLAREDMEGVFTSPLFVSTGNSHNEHNLTTADSFEMDPEDEPGPFNVALEATKTDKGKAYIIGSPYFFSDTVDNATANASVTVFMNMVNSTISADSAMTAVVPVRSMGSDPFIIDSLAGIIIFLVVMVVVPLAMIIAGLVIWFRRRRK